MFIKVLIFTLVTTYITAELPSYIQVCGRRNPNLDECFATKMTSLKNQLCEGIQELDVRPLKVLHLDTVIIIDTDAVKLNLKNIQISGLCDFDVNSLHIDLDKLHLNAQTFYKQIRVNTTYDFDLHLLTMPIATTGEAFFIVEDVIVNTSIDMKIIRVNGKRHIYISKVTINLKIKEFKSQFENSSDQMREIIKNFIDNNQQEVLAIITPALEKAISETVISISNNIVKPFTFDELFPDRT